MRLSVKQISTQLRSAGETYASRYAEIETFNPEEYLVRPRLFYHEYYDAFVEEGGFRLVYTNP